MGSALEYNGDIIYVDEESVNSTNAVPQITQKTGNTFRVLIPRMADGDSLVFRYSATVDYSGIRISGNPSFEETGNTAQIFGDSYSLDNTAVYHETDIGFSDLEKNCINKSKKSQSGNLFYTLTWEIDTNKSAQYPLADTEITDTISPDIAGISKYTGNGITVKCYSVSGELCETRNISWEELDVDITTELTWTYHIPDTDPMYHYVITYDTIVDMSGQTQNVVAGNTAEGKGGIDSDRAVLTPDGEGGIFVSKEATNVDSTHITWEITMTVSGTAYDYERIVLTEHCNTRGNTWENDKMPYRWIVIPGEASRIYKETLKKVEVLGLEEDETFTVNYNNTAYNAEPGNNVLENMFVGKDRDGDTCNIEFFKDQSRTEGGINHPADKTQTRTIKLRLTTEYPEEWATYARDYMLATASRSISPFTHVNWISVDTPDSTGKLVTRTFDTDKVVNMPPHIYKTVLTNVDTTLSSAAPDYYILDYPDCIIRPWNTTETGSLYPDALELARNV